MRANVGAPKISASTWPKPAESLDACRARNDGDVCQWLSDIGAVVSFVDGLQAVQADAVAPGALCFVQRGVGIPDDRLETVFQPFFQGDSSLARRFDGIGLGLSIAKSLVERHGGRLEIRSLEGTGTSVVIHLPKERFLTDW